jgi:hypothetical protein
MINTTTTKNYSNWNVLWSNMRNSLINYKCFMPCLVQCLIEEWDGSLYIVTRLWAGRPRNRSSILPWTWGHYLIQTIRNGSGAHPDFYSTATGGSLPSGRAAAARAIHLYLVTRLRIRGAILPLPPYAFMAYTGSTCFAVLTAVWIRREKQSDSAQDAG